MADPVVLRCGGLMTDPNPVLTAEMGAMRQALNVIIDRPGVASQRPSLETLSSKASAQRPRRIHIFRDTTPVVASWDGASTWSIDTSSATITGTAEPLDYLKTFVQFVEARKNLYWTSKDGLYKITGTTDTAGELAGLHEACSGTVSANLATGTPAVFPTNIAVAYRWCFTRYDANGMLVRSAPSPWQSATNTSGATRDGFLDVPLPTYVVAGDTLEIYRSKYVTPSTATPSDQMYLVQKYRVLAADVTATYVSIADRLLEAKLGAELYTSPGREGILKENGRPPACAAAALWAGCTWVGATKDAWTGILELLNSAGSARTVGDLGYVNKSTAVTIGSAVATVASTAELSIGMLLTEGTSAPGSTGVSIDIGVTIATIDSATQITMSANALATNAALDVRYHDKVTIGSENFYAHSSSLLGARSSTIYPYFLASTVELTTASELARVITANSAAYFANAIEDAATGPAWSGGVFARRPGAIIIRRVSLSGAVFTISTTNNTAFNFQTTPDTNIILVERDDKPNRVCYSKIDEPEHFPALNRLDIGSEAHAVLALAALRASLIVAKEDGLYRVTGSGPDNWRVDKIGEQALLRGECISSDGEMAYAWTTEGALEIDESGVVNVSEGKVGRELQTRTEHLFANAGTIGYWVQVCPRLDAVIFGAPTADNSQDADLLYVFHRTTRGWSTWDFVAYCAAASWRIGAGAWPLVLARGGAFWELRKAASFPGTGNWTGFDKSYGLSGWTYTAGTTLVTVSDAQRGDWTPKAGDWVSGDVSGLAEYRRVTAAVDTGTAYDLTIDSAFSAAPTANRSGYEGIISKLQWQAVSQGALARTRMCTRIHMMLEWVQLNAAYTGTTAHALVGAATDVTPAIATVESTAETRAAKVFNLDVTPPRNVARASLHMPYFETTDIGLEWRCNGVVLDFEATGSERVNR